MNSRRIHASRLSRISSILLVCLIWIPASAISQELVYRPTAGRTYDYGIEYRVVEIREDERKPERATHRCRLRYTIIKSDSDGWIADYAAIPFLGGHPTTPEQYAQVLSRRRERVEQGPRKLPPTGIPRIDQQRELASKQMAARLEREYQMTRYYPGLLDHVAGKIDVTRDGRVNSVTGNGTLPFLTGHIAQLVLLRLSPDGKPDYSYKDVASIYVRSSSTTELESSEASLLSVMNREESKIPNLVNFHRDLETTGGGSIGMDYRLSGEGIASFSNELKMPYSGSLDLNANGFSFTGSGGKHKVRIGFHYLDGWAGEFFDNGLLPIPTAFSPENLPRISSKQQAAMKRYWGSSQMDTSIHDYALASAPPPYDSPLQKGITEILNRDPSSEKSSSAFSSQRLALNQIDARWRTIRKMALLLPRTWSDASDAFKIEAQMVSRDGDSVTLKRNDTGKLATLPLSRLSQADAEFAKTFGMPAQ